MSTTTYDRSDQESCLSGHVTVSGAILATPGRVKAVIAVPGALAGTVIIKDGGSSGTTVLTIDTIASATGNPVVVPIPAAGIPCGTSIYCAISNAVAATVIYAQ